MSSDRYGVIAPSVPVYPSPMNGGTSAPQTTASPVVVVSPPEMSNVLWQLQDTLGKLVGLLEAEVWGRAGSGDMDCVEVSEIVRDKDGLIIEVRKHKEYS